ncbi:MAG: LacI family DNA-binding transcriptional regulator [Bacillota bacterium]
MRRWTTRQVARLAGVSPATVSRVLNQQGGVSPELARRVWEAVRQLEEGKYAEGGQTTCRVAVAIPRRIEAYDPEPVGGSFYGQVLLGVEEVLRSEGHYLSLFTYDPGAGPEWLNGLQDRCDALILMGADTPDELAREAAGKGLPVVVVDRHVRGVDSVISDNVGGAEEVTAHVLAAGYRTVVYICETFQDPSFAARREGFDRAVQAAGRPVAVRYAEVGRGWLDAPGAMEELLATAELPMAVVAGNDLTALQILAIARARGLRVPEDLGLAGFDDIALAARATPGLTTVRVDKVEMGRLAARRLLDRIRERDLLPVTITMHVALVVRGSTDLGASRSDPRADPAGATGRIIHPSQQTEGESQ